ncbi:MAG: hypothetical protein ABL949_09455 [Fimbriimonadaceae bacterium]
MVTPSSYDYEVRRSGRWFSRSRSLFRGDDFICEVKDSLGWSKSLIWASSSPFQNLRIRGQQSGIIPLPENEEYVGWVKFELRHANAGELFASFAVSEGEIPLASRREHHRFRLWRQGIGSAVFTPEGESVLTTHEAWRDSETDRGMLEGYNIHGEVDQMIADLAAVGAMLMQPAKGFIRASRGNI